MARVRPRPHDDVVPFPESPMNRMWRRRPSRAAGIALASLVLACTAAPALAQSGGGGYTLRWYTVDGGGLTLSQSGPPQFYRVSGTVGQPDAGVLTGGVYQLVGGFWIGDARAITAVEPEPEAPVAY